MRVAVLIPARNEEASLPLVLDAIPADRVEEIVVVDNASSDRTAETARSRGATVLFEPRPGYGAACLRGIDYLRTVRPDVVVFLDADFSDHPEEMRLLLQAIERDGADLVIGSRTLGLAEPGALLPQARFGNWLATRLMRLLYGGRFSDLGPFRAIRFGALIDLAMEDRGFGWTAEMQVKALKHRLRTAEVPVSYRRRVGVSKITGTLSGTLRAGAGILWTIVRNAPCRPGPSRPRRPRDAGALRGRGRSG
ncbi:MAG: UDP-glucose--dolichyl-phosphate glucosyltransferase [Acidobacteria bacterium 13_1_40CM_4_69_4]|nr:MAG: UDP-glucose--dolichyl-phosphate glucosyltransferase [Acidobacteria bacterium 13_1_40CM_4_69_4]